ncbi:TLDc domain-containing protein [Entamoeba marina]
MQERQKLLDEFDENLKAVKLSAFNIGNYCRTKEVEEVEEILLRCDIEISGDKLEDIIIEYHRLNKGIQGIIEHKKIIIKYVIKMKKSKKDVLNGIDLDKILQSMIVNVNKLISCQNRLIDRIKDINIDIFCRDNAITEGFRKPLCVLTNPCVEKRYEMNLLKQNPSDNGMEMIFDNNDVLKKWSRKKKYNVIFDSRMYGDGSNNGLRNEVINKSSLYFIVFDDNDNIFGGYVNSIIYTDNVPIRDDSSFVFSFVRNNKLQPRKYNIKQQFTSNALQYFQKHVIITCYLNLVMTLVVNYDYFGEENVLRNIDVIEKEYVVKRVIVVEMK